MSVTIIEERDKQVEQLVRLHEKAKRWVRKMTCRRCGSVFRFNAVDLVPTKGDYGCALFWAPHIGCPSCTMPHVYWFRMHFFNRWIGHYLRLRAQRPEWEPENDGPNFGRLLDL